jgi:prephenate dehydrogenase
MRKAIIVGLGLIGGSMAKALRRKAGFGRIDAVETNAASVRAALAEGVIDDCAETVEEIAGRDYNFMFLCVPAGAAVSQLARAAAVAGPRCVITDVGSVKTGIVRAAESLGLTNFVGGHPMTGSERSGYSASWEYMFENAFYLLTPSAGADPSPVDAMRGLVSDIGGIPVVMRADEHDRVAAAVSHLPHIVAASLVNAVAGADRGGETKTLASGGFRDITRIASSDARMWQNICAENGGEIAAMLVRFRDSLDDFERSIQTRDWDGTERLFLLAKEYRDSLSSGRKSPFLASFELYADIVDKPGSIATVATLLSVNGINIKNIGIVNNRENQGGVLSISFDRERDMLRSAELLKNMNYKTYMD